MTKRFNDGVLDLSALREKKAEELVQEEVVAPVNFDPNIIMKTIPSEFEATDDQGNDVSIKVISVAIMSDKIYMVLTDDSEQPFLMVGFHENNVFTEELKSATEEDLNAYNSFIEEYKKAEAAKVADEVQGEQQRQLAEMLEKADSEEEREQIRSMMNQ